MLRSHSGVVVVTVVASIAACTGGGFDPNEPIEIPDAGNLDDIHFPDAGNLSDIPIPQPPTIDLESIALPIAADGNAILIELNDGRIELDPTASDAITAVGNCTDLVTYCFSPPDLSLATCVAATPPCLTDEPWTEAIPCCPQTCRAQFATAVAVGADELDAFQDVFFREPDCFPGLAALVTP